jgi:hypothetical protein
MPQRAGCGRDRRTLVLRAQVVHLLEAGCPALPSPNILDNTRNNREFLSMISDNNKFVIHQLKLV